MVLALEEWPRQACRARLPHYWPALLAATLCPLPVLLRLPQRAAEWLRGLGAQMPVLMAQLWALHLARVCPLQQRAGLAAVRPS